MQTRVALAAGALVAAILSQPAYACDEWELNGRSLSLSQNNRSVVSLDLVQNGAAIDGAARFYHHQVESFANVVYWGADYTGTGRVRGHLAGNDLRLRIEWDGGISVGVYQLRVMPDGSVEGETYDFAKTSSRAQVIGTKRLTCKEATPAPTPPAAPPPPPSSLGTVNRAGPKVAPPPSGIGHVSGPTLGGPEPVSSVDSPERTLPPPVAGAGR